MIEFEVGKLYQVVDVVEVSNGAVVTDTLIFKTLNVPDFENPWDVVNLDLRYVGENELEEGDIFMFLGFHHYSKAHAPDEVFKTLYILMGETIWQTNEPLSMLKTHVTFERVS